MIRAVVFDLWNTLLFSPAGSPFQRLKGLLRPDQASLHGAMTVSYTHLTLPTKA